MIIKHGKHIFGKIHEIRKGLWAFFSLLCFSDADWLSRQTPITWLLTCSPFWPPIPIIPGEPIDPCKSKTNIVSTGYTWQLNVHVSITNSSCSTTTFIPRYMQLSLQLFWSYPTNIFSSRKTYMLSITTNSVYLTQINRLHVSITTNSAYLTQINLHVSITTNFAYLTSARNES